ncbi:hypothetical protein ON010_g13164 [Phytophthora cinnamomi]|nr:hypothetical protein ON010_g13164 [Phytophthora cinnamomi]
MLKEELNFLNPGQETFMQLWKSYGTAEDVFTGNEGPIKSTRYSRFAVVAWPVSRHLENALNLMSAELAVEELLSRRPVDAIVLRSFLDAVVVRYGFGPFYREADLAALFLTKYCPRLGDLNGNETMIPTIIKVANTYAWSAVGALLDVLGNQTDLYQFYETPGDSEMELLLQVADAVNDTKARQDLIKMAVEKDLKLRTSKVVDMFWKHIILPGDTEVFKSMTDKVTQKKPSELGPFVQVFSKYIDKRDTTGKFAVLEAIAASRQFAIDLKHDNLWEASFILQVVEGDEPVLTITKTREWFDDSQKKLVQHKEEMAQLTEHYNSSRKKARHD